MAGLASDPLAVGGAALAEGDWQVAREAFEAALAREDTPGAHDGLGRALWWIEGPGAAVVERTRPTRPTGTQEMSGARRGSRCGSRTSTRRALATRSPPAAG
jgi:hypothetical protein